MIIYLAVKVVEPTLVNVSKKMHREYKFKKLQQSLYYNQLIIIYYSLNKQTFMFY